MQKRHESVDKRHLQNKFKPDCKKSISLKYLLGLIFGAMLHWMGREKEEVGRVLGGNGSTGNIHRAADYQRLGEYSVWMSLVHNSHAEYVIFFNI